MSKTLIKSSEENWNYMAMLKTNPKDSTTSPIQEEHLNKKNLPLHLHSQSQKLIILTV